MSEILVSRGLYFGKEIILVCDRQCNKAWGINKRPRVYLQGEDKDPDDYYYIPDGELGEAPVNPGTYEGGDSKPDKPTKHNKWCARECERCEMIGLSDELKQGDSVLTSDLSKRVYNKRQED